MIRSVAAPQELAAARRVLICLRYGIGDVVMQWPVLQSLRRACPNAEIVALGAAPATQLLEYGPADRAVTSQSLGLGHFGDDSARGRRAVEEWLDAEGPFDLTFDALHAVKAVREVLWRRGVATCEADQDVQSFHTRRGEGLVRGIYESARAGWGIDPGDAAAGAGTLSPRLEPSAADERWADDWLTRRNLRRPPAVSPVASLHLKRWPMDRLAAVADELCGVAGEAALLFAGPCDDLAGEVTAAMRTTPAVVGDEHLGRVAALLARCRVLVANDTGLLHLAEAVGTRSVGIFGPTSPRVAFARAGPGGRVGGDSPCPHRNDAEPWMPACWQADRCLLDLPGGCVRAVSVAQVLAAASPSG